MKHFLLLFSVLFLLSCDKNKKDTMFVSGEVKGLKRGTIFLQNFNEKGVATTIDSVIADGNGKFHFEVPLKSPEVFALFLDKKQKNDFGNEILFFGEATNIHIETENENFSLNARVSGSQTQPLLETYIQTMRQFSLKNTNYLYEQLLALKENNQRKADSIVSLMEKNQKRQVLYAVNYALNHKDSYISPYIIVSDNLENVNPVYLDSIYRSLSTDVANSKYGILLKKYLEDQKSQK